MQKIAEVYQQASQFAHFTEHYCDQTMQNGMKGM